jgi:hypothetical protein
MPLAEACHVALQRHPASAQPAAIRVVSFNAGAASRGPAFEVALSELVRRNMCPYHAVLSFRHAHAHSNKKLPLWDACSEWLCGWTQFTGCELAAWHLVWQPCSAAAQLSSYHNIL